MGGPASSSSFSLHISSLSPFTFSPSGSPRGNLMASPVPRRASSWSILTHRRSSVFSPWRSNPSGAGLAFAHHRPVSQPAEAGCNTGRTENISQRAETITEESEMCGGEGRLAGIPSTRRTVLFCLRQGGERLFFCFFFKGF